MEKSNVPAPETAECFASTNVSNVIKCVEKTLAAKLIAKLLILHTMRCVNDEGLNTKLNNLTHIQSTSYYKLTSRLQVKQH
jgi:hypothetical protein